MKILDSINHYNYFIKRNFISIYCPRFKFPLEYLVFIYVNLELIKEFIYQAIKCAGDQLVIFTQEGTMSKIKEGCRKNSQM